MGVRKSAFPSAFRKTFAQYQEPTDTWLAFRYARCVALLAITLALPGAPALKADSVLLTDNYGSGLLAAPPYYVGGSAGSCYSYTVPGGPEISAAGYYEVLDCSGGTVGAGDGYPYSVGGDTIPGTVFVGDPGGYISDEITTTVSAGEFFSSVEFTFSFGLDLTGSPATCDSVGGCNLAYDGSIQDLGTITWGPGWFNPAGGATTALRFQYNSPEPASLSTFSFGLAGLALLFGKRRRSS
jgi:MYXO-CTERM domain-containing protein